MSIRVAGSCKKHFVPLNLMVLTRYAIYLLQAVILAHVLSENLCPSCRPGVRKKCHIVHVFEKVVALCWALGVAATLKHLWCITASPRSRVRMRPRARQARQVTSGDLGGHTRSLIKAKRAKKPSCTHRLAEQRAKRAERDSQRRRGRRSRSEAPAVCRGLAVDSSPASPLALGDSATRLALCLFPVCPLPSLGPHHTSAENSVAALARAVSAASLCCLRAVKSPQAR